MCSNFITDVKLFSRENSGIIDEIIYSTNIKLVHLYTYYSTYGGAKMNNIIRSDACKSFTNTSSLSHTSGAFVASVRGCKKLEDTCV